MERGVISIYHGKQRSGKLEEFALSHPVTGAFEFRVVVFSYVAFSAINFTLKEMRPFDTFRHDYMLWIFPHS